MTPVFLPEESHGQRSVVGYSPWGCAGVQPWWIQGNLKGRRNQGPRKKLIYRYKERLEKDSVVGNISGEKDAE